jgi:SNF2 family DNA or RNA helicase
MINKILVDYDPKTKRLVLQAGFHMLDILRSFPSRRFDPKTKAWKVPLVKANINHFNEIKHKYEWDFAADAEAAIANFEKLTAGPTYVAFPHAQASHLMKLPPMEHQWAMLDKGWNLPGYALFAAMGTGKTYVTIAIALARWNFRQIDRLMIICPATLRRTWAKEFKKYANGDFVDFRYHSTQDRGMAAWAQAPNDRLKVLAVSVEGLGISEKMFDTACGFLVDAGGSMVVCDESSRIKNPDAKRTERAIILASATKYRMILNGTPIAKGLHDLWAQYEFLDPNIIGAGDYWAFKTRYVVMGGYENKQIIGYSHVEELMNLVTPYTTEVNKKLLNLPPKVPKTIYIEPTPEQNRLFDKILTGIGDGHISTKNVLERMLRMQQVIGGFEPQTDIETDITTTKPLEKNPKMDAMLQFIEDNQIGTKFIIWARYVPEIKAIVGKLSRAYGPEAVLTYYGGTSQEERAESERRYCSDPTARFLVGNPSAAGLGLTLISGENDVMFYYSGTFAYIDRAQSEDRAHRIGQQNSVAIVDCVMTGSIDEAIVAAIASKMDMDQFVKDWIAKGNMPADLLRGAALDTPPQT